MISFGRVFPSIRTGQRDVRHPLLRDTIVRIFAENIVCFAADNRLSVHILSIQKITCTKNEREADHPVGIHSGTHSMENMIKKVVIASAGVLSACAGLYAYDLWDDRRHEIEIVGKTPVYASREPYPQREAPLFSVSANDRAVIKRIRYGKNHMAMNIETSDGRSGWVFYGPTLRIR